jgi:membrane protein DedA with SNARE-associated domain
MPVLASILPPVLAMFGNKSLLETIHDWMATPWGYAVLFGLLFSCGLGVPLPEDIPLLLAGYFVADGQMHPAVAAVCAWLGIMGGDCMLYMFGRKYGLEITKVPVIGTHVTRERIGEVQKLFEKYGVGVVAVGRLFAGIRGAMVITAGAIRFRFWQFIVADGLAAVVSGGLFMFLGYKGREWFGSLETIRQKVETSQRWVLLGVILIAIGFAARHVWKKQRKKKLPGSTVDPTPTDVMPPG